MYRGFGGIKGNCKGRGFGDVYIGCSECTGGRWCEGGTVRGGDLVTCTLGVVSVQGFRWCEAFHRHSTDGLVYDVM